ncbi:MAG: dienelactone hydrolase family protein [Opitutaceae bacterium]
MPPSRTTPRSRFALRVLARSLPVLGPLMIGLTAAVQAAPVPAEVWSARLPGSPSWDAALKSGALEPIDVEALLPSFALPDPLRRPDGTDVRDPITWAQQRQDLLKLLQHYVIGTLPPPPRTARAVEPSTERDGGVVRTTLVLEFSPRFDARLSIELLAPPGTGPFPVLLVPASHRDWAVIAVSRGYLACVFRAGDAFDDTPTFAGLHPGSDWTLLARRAWAAGRCIDYLETRSEVDRSRFALAGAGRQAAQALVAAAFDERIAAVIAAGSGLGGAVPFRLATESDGAAGIEGTTRGAPDWLHPRLRFFSGQEQRLPVDQHYLLACIAPRAVLLSSARCDPRDPLWAVEQSWRSARSVYGLHQREDALQLDTRGDDPEVHRADVDRFLDWLDGRFGRGAPTPAVEPSFPTYADWQRLSRERLDPARFPAPAITAVLGPDARRPLRSRADWLEQRNAVRGRVSWVLGEIAAYPESRPVVLTSALPLRVPTPPPDSELIRLAFGSGVVGELHRPVGATPAQPVPAVIWLPPSPLPAGPWGAESRAPALESWLSGGFAVLTFDPIGSGPRSDEMNRFYHRHPHGSLFGQWLQDTRDAVTALLQQKSIDSQRIHLVGYGIGGLVALHAAALDERVAGVVCVNGLTPLRSDTPDKALGGVARWSLRFPWLPRLGAFVGNEDRIPYDLDEVLALIAPRPVTVVRSSRDSTTSTADVRSIVQRAGSVYGLYGRAAALRLLEVDDYHRFSPAVARETYRALKTLEVP